MRDAIRHLPDLPSHFGLAYDMWAPVATEGDKAGKVSDGQRQEWFRSLEKLRVSRDYQVAFDRWEAALEVLGATRVEVRSQSRLLLGHGNPSATETGLTVHHTWGVPVLPGSSLKGLLQHHLVEKYGPEPEHWDLHPLAQEHAEPERAPFQPAAWNKRAVLHSPGAAIRAIFGAPDAISDDEGPWQGTAQVGAAKGQLRFLDGWWKMSKGEEAKPFATDILNVHQRSYYGQDGPRSWPNDYGSPIPHQFITVRPQQAFVLAVVGEPELAKWAMEELLEALAERGLGGKTTAGYGELRGEPGRIKLLKKIAASPALDDLQSLLAGTHFPPGLSSDSAQREIFNYVADTLKPRLLELTDAQRNHAGKLIGKKFLKHSKLGPLARTLLSELKVPEAGS